MAEKILITSQDIRSTVSKVDEVEKVQPKLTAGEGISISDDNVISATAGSLPAIVNVKVNDLPYAPEETSYIFNIELGHDQYYLFSLDTTASPQSLEVLIKVPNDQKFVLAAPTLQTVNSIVGACHCGFGIGEEDYNYFTIDFLALTGDVRSASVCINGRTITVGSAITDR